MEKTGTGDFAGGIQRLSVAFVEQQSLLETGTPIKYEVAKGKPRPILEKLTCGTHGVGQQAVNGGLLRPAGDRDDPTSSWLAMTRKHRAGAQGGPIARAR